MAGSFTIIGDFVSLTGNLPPERPEDLKRRANASRTPYTIEFDETERGKKVYVERDSVDVCPVKAVNREQGTAQQCLFFGF